MGASAYPQQELLGRGPTWRLSGLAVQASLGFGQKFPRACTRRDMELRHVRATTLSMAFSAGSDSMYFELVIFKYI